MSIRKISNKINQINEKTMVVYRSKNYGLIWAGQIIFLYNSLTREALTKKAELTKDGQGSIVILVN